MKGCLAKAFLGMALGLSSCTDDGATQPTSTESARLCALSGTVLRLGSDDPLAYPDEKPGWTRFRHDVWMDTTEMTQAEYRSLRGTNPSLKQGDKLPVTDVSWFDAVLAANARSRRDGLDTVYAYTSIQADSAGNAWGLQGLSVRLDRDGWRLPTEAEWEAVARAGTSSPWTWGTLADSAHAGTYAWYQANSAGTPHAVATRSPNAWGIHDMAGNVMEWVNDWKGSFPRDTVPDFAGPSVPGEVAQAPVKGGAYIFGLTHLRPSSRTSTYASYRSVRAEYVGFRLARGAFEASYTGASGEVDSTPQVTLLRTDLARLMGAWEARLVFVNRHDGRGVLTWIDYGESSPVARSLRDKDPVFHPAISPDGRWVAWSTVLEGSLEPGRVKARLLASYETPVVDLGEGAIPRWWVDGTDTFLVRSSAMDNLAGGWSATRTTARRWSNGTFTGPEETWVPNGSFHDGRSGGYLFTGYRRLRRYDLRTGASSVMFTGPGNGKGDGDTSQVCNVSAAPDTSGRVMFLDFGFGDSSGLVGRSYGIHEVAFVSDRHGKVVGQIPSPPEEAQWEHMEWSNASRWAVSGSIDRSGAYRNLYLVDVDSGGSIRIASGEQLWQPALWVGGKTSAPAGAYDSAALYNVPAAGDPRMTFEMKMLRFWKRPEIYEAVFLGSSRTNFGIAAGEFRMPTFNMGVMHGDLLTQDRLLRDYIVPHCPRLRVVGLCLMPGWMWKTYGGFSWNEISSGTGYRYDRSHGFWAPKPPAWFLDAVGTRAASTVNFADSSGSMPTPAKGWGSLVAVEPPDSESFEDSTFKLNWSILTKIVSDLDSMGIATVLVNFPTHPVYGTNGYADIYGPTDSTFTLLEGRIKALETRYRSFHYHDAHKRGRHDYTDSMAADRDHLSVLGSRLLSRRLDSLIAGILGNP